MSSASEEKTKMILARCILASFLIFSNFLLGLTCGMATNVGVKPGQWAKYSSVTYERGRLPFTVYITISIENISGSTVFGAILYDYRSGPPQTQPLQVDVTRGTAPPFIIPANLNVGDYVRPYYSNASERVEGVTTRNCAGASRTVVYTTIKTVEIYGNFTYRYYWDQETGIFVEQVEEEGGTVMTRSYKLDETNIWSRSFFDASNFLFWFLTIIACIAGAIIAVRSMRYFKERKFRERSLQSNAESK